MGRLEERPRVLRVPATTTSVISTPISPHTTRRRVPTCSACHQNPARLGLGSGPWPLGAGAASDLSRFPRLNWKADWDKLLNARHMPIQGSTHPGARALNHDELVRVLRFGFCLPCHSSPTDPVVQDPGRAYRLVAPGGRLRARHEKAMKQWFVRPR